MSTQPNPRFNQYTEIVKNNEVVGFKLDDNDFEFLFDKFGGWYDEQGRYYNADAIECEAPEVQSDDDSEDEQKQNKSEHLLQQKMIKLKINSQRNDKIEVIRKFQQILQSYPNDQQIPITFSLQPTVDNEPHIVQNFINSKIQEKITINENGQILGLTDHALATQIIQLQGSQIEVQSKVLTLYIYVDLFDSVEVSIRMKKNELEYKLNELCYEENSDYANIMEEKDGEEVMSWFQIRRDIAGELKEDIDYQLVQE